MLMTMTQEPTKTYTEPDLRWAIIDSRQGKVLARFESQAFAKVSLDACSARLSAYRDVLAVQELPQD